MLSILSMHCMGRFTSRRAQKQNAPRSLNFTMQKYKQYFDLRKSRLFSSRQGAVKQQFKQKSADFLSRLFAD